MKTLTDDEVRGALTALPGWSLTDGALTWQHSFADAIEAFGFLTRVALLAERANHHPDVTLSYNRLRLQLVSHDAGGVTARDLELAQAIGTLEVR